ncbi:single-stranded DNA-binding protein [Vreelandella olivaria]|uniref:single-stranded DNA-binding protein n=1 Tax=Vreelandella olivaria TaxID=390919 RepID=UPI00201ECDDA|nr:single-stranded DNA-binding protein [Halomonas olivaria]
MSTRFFGEGNIGSDPTCRMFPGNGNQAPRGVLRLNVRFDNLVPGDDGMVDRGGFWANVELWGRQVEQWASLYQRGQRVIVFERMVQETWEKDGETQTAMKVMGDRVGILPFRVSQVVMEGGQGQEQVQTPPHPQQAYQPPVQQQAPQQAGMQDGGDDGLPF